MTTPSEVPVHVATAVMPGQQLSSSGRVLLADLRDSLAAAHEQVCECRRAPVDQQQLTAARRAHVSAMVAYEQALRALSLPIPPRLRDELRLLRRIADR